MKKIYDRVVIGIIKAEVKDVITSSLLKTVTVTEDPKGFVVVSEEDKF